jgi:nitronate monooxygenase
MSVKIPVKITSQMELPVISAPMFLVSGPEMVVAECKEGIIGTFPLANARTLEDLDDWMTYINENLALAESMEPDRKIAPWGVNLVVHRTNKRYEEDLEFIKKYQPPIVITSLGDPSRAVSIVHEYGGLVFSDVINLKHAKKAVEKGTDGLILVCNGAGGHAGTFNPFAFIAGVKEFWDGITIMAGGISSGKDIYAAQILGADMVYMGTRFIAAAESMAECEYRNLLIESTLEDIIYTDAISGVNANFLIPSLVKAGMNPEKLQRKETFDWSNENRNGAKAWKDIFSAGHGVTTVKQVETVAEIVSKLKKEYEEVKR